MPLSRDEKQGMAMTIVGLAVFAWLTVANIGSCVTNPETGETELDLNLVHQELSLTEQDIRDYAGIVMAENPERAMKLAQFADSLHTVDAAVQEALLSGERAGLLEAANLALSAAQPFLEDADEDVRLAAFLARAALRRIQFYAEG